MAAAAVHPMHSPASSRVTNWRRTVQRRLMLSPLGDFGRTLGYRAILAMLVPLPRRLSLCAVRTVGAIRYRWHRSENDLQAANICARLGVTSAVAEAVLKRSFQLRTAVDIDSATLRLRKRGDVLRLIRIRGIEQLDAVLAAGKGAILYSGHVNGNYAFYAALGLLGYKPNFIRLSLDLATRPLVERAFARGHFLIFDTKFGCRTILMRQSRITSPLSSSSEQGASPLADRRADGGNSVRRGAAKAQAIAALQRNEVVIILIDLSQSSQNVAVRFFDRTAWFPRGPYALAAATGAPLLDFYIHRDASLREQIAEIGTPLLASESDCELLQACASRLEAHIRRHPADWAPWHSFDSEPTASGAAGHDRNVGAQPDGRAAGIKA